MDNLFKIRFRKLFRGGGGLICIMMLNVPEIVPMCMIAVQEMMTESYVIYSWTPRGSPLG